MPTLRSSRAQTRLPLLLLLACSFILAAGGSGAQARKSGRRAGSTSLAIAAARSPGLITAARLSRRADGALVADARRLRRCRSAHPYLPARCARARHTLELAGRRAAGTKRSLAVIVRATGGSATSGAQAATWQLTRLAPTLTVSGQTLTWTRVSSITSYVLATMVPGQPTQYSVVTGTSITPPPVPAKTVRYSVRTTVSGAAWSAAQAVSYPAVAAPAEPVDTQAAPVLRVSGQTLTWNATPGVTTYVFVRKVSGHTDEYSELTGTSTTPAALPGSTVHFSVRTAVEGSAWAPEVAINYPASPTAEAPATEAPRDTPKEAPAPAGFQPGINSGSAAIWELPGAEQLGAKLVRIDFGVAETAQQIEPVIAAYAAQGIRVAPLADFDGTIPTAAEAQNLAGWAKAFGPGGTFWAGKSDGALAIQTIEFGNETSYSYQYSNDTPAGYASRAQSYALRFAEAATAIRAADAGVGLLAQGDAGNAGSLWIENMFKAVPGLSSLVAGWTIHPYGPGWKTRFETLISQTAAQGAPSSIPIDVTEWGLSTDNGRCLSENYGWNACMSYQEAAEALTRTVSEMRTMLNGRLGMFLLYEIRDQQISGTTTDREAYFGAVQHELQPKGAYTTAVQSLLAGSS